MKKRRWSKEEKLQILKEAQENGKEVTLRKYKVYPSTYYTWKKRYTLEGASAFEDAARKKKNQQYICRLEDENALLKQLLAEKELEIALRDELIKKKYPWARKKT